MRLEPELWEALEEICQRESVTVADLVKRIEHAGHPGGRTSAVRVHVLNYFRNAANAGSARRSGLTQPDRGWTGTPSNREANAA